MNNIKFAIDTLVECRLHNPPAYIALLAVIYYDKHEHPDRPEYSKGTFKRAIKKMRETQTSNPELFNIFEQAIAFVRREWMTNNAI